MYILDLRLTTCDFQVELNYMFEHWLDVRKGPLLNIGQQLRLGRYPGFEEGASSAHVFFFARGFWFWVLSR